MLELYYPMIQFLISKFSPMISWKVWVGPIVTLDFALWIQDSWYWIRDSLSVELEFQIPCAEYSGFLKKRFPGFLILQAKTSQIPESGLPYMLQKFTFTPVLRL